MQKQKLKQTRNYYEEFPFIEGGEERIRWWQEYLKPFLPDDLIKKMAQLKLLGMTFPVEYGGSNAGSLDCILAIEELSYSGTGAWWLLAFCNSIP